MRDYRTRATTLARLKRRRPVVGQNSYSLRFGLRKTCQNIKKMHKENYTYAVRYIGMNTTQ